MPIIQKIRDKGAALVIGIIALSLIGFLLMDAKSGSAKLFGNNNNTVIGKVNGDPIEIDEFNAKEKETEQQYGNMNTGGAMRYQIRQSTWDNLVAERLLSGEFRKLGLEFTPREMLAQIFSEDAPAQLKQAFTDPDTKQYDIEKAKQWWAQVRKTKNEEQRNLINTQVIAPLRLNTLYGKYSSMISGSAYMPTWLQNEDKGENNSFANISYVAIPYSDISDSAIKVTDGDIQDYLQAHSAKYKQEGGRLISYVVFSGSPSAKDTQAVKEGLETLKPTFSADTTAKAFVTRNLSATPYSDAYIPKAKLPQAFKDTLASLATGTVFGPYLDGGNYVLAKKLDTKTMPDSIKCRHILLGADKVPDSIAKKRIDSIETAIKGGANFDSLEAKYSTDLTAHKDKGVMTFDLATTQTGLAKEFGDFLLNEKGETKKSLKTQFGWHYVEILEKKNPQATYKIAYLAKEIVPSEETQNAANSAAIKLSGQARNVAQFDDYIAKNGLNKVSFPNVVKENDYQLGTLQDARGVIKWAFDAKEGDVSDPMEISQTYGRDYVVAVVARKIDEGVPDAKTGRPMVESIIRNHKKAEQIKKTLGTPASLEAAASAFKKQVLTTTNDSTLTFKATLINGVGNEPKVAGATFNKDYQTSVSPAIEGNTGVFVIKVNSISAKAEEAPEAAKQKMAGKLSQLAQSSMSQSFQSLKKQADITDRRSKFF